MAFQPFMPFFQDDPLQQQAFAPPPLTPDDQTSLLGQIGSGALTGLGYVGSILEKPGRIIRGALTGNARELGNLVPFSDALGITDPSQNVTGAGLNYQLGLTDNPNPDFFSWQGLGGLATDLATDPLTFLGTGLFKGALTPLGKAAQKAGVAIPKNISGPGGRLAGFAASSPEAAQLAKATGKSVADVAGQRLGGHFSLGLPFSGSEAVFDASSVLDPAAKYLQGLGGAAASIPGIGPVLGGAGRGLATAAEATGRYGRALFAPAVEGQLTDLGQEYGRGISAAKRAADASARQEFLPIMKALGGDFETDAQGLRNLIERTGPGSAGAMAAEPLARQALENIHLREVSSAVAEPGSAMTDYLRRQVHRPELDIARGGKGGGSGWQTGHSSLISRDSPIGDLTTDVVNRLARDPELSTPGRTLAGPAAAQKIASLTGKPIADAEKIADLLYDLHPERLKIGLMEKPAATELLDRLTQGHRAAGTADYLMGQMAQRATDKATAGPGAKNLKEVVAALGLKEGGARNIFAGTNPGKALEELYVNRDTVDALLKVTKPFKVPEVIQPALDKFRSFTSLFKGLNTSPWPGFHVRNKLSNIWTKGDVIGNQAILQAGKDSRAAFKGEAIAEAGKVFGNLSDAAATSKLAEEAFSHGVTLGGFMRESGAGESLKDIAQGLPGFRKRDVGTLQAVGQYGKDLASTPGKLAGAYKKGGMAGVGQEMKVRGVGGATESTLGPLKAGEALGGTIEQADKFGAYVGLRKQGWSAEAAAEKVKKAFVNYEDLTGFERNFLKDVIPFYSFTKQNTINQIQNIAREPGGRTATALKVAGRAQGDGYTPQQLGQGISVPIGERSPEGVQSFFSQLGLPFEDLGNLSQPGRFLGGMLNPALRFPLEQLSGRQLTTGRDLRDLYSGIGSLTGESMPLLEGAFFNSPLARLGTTARTIVDQRKSTLSKILNLGTGFRISDIDMPKSQLSQTRSFIEDQLRGEPGVGAYQRLFVKPEDMQNLSPREQQLYQLYQNLLRQRKKNP